MRQVFRIFRRDVLALLYNRRVILFLILMPPVLLSLIGGLRVKSDNVAVRVLFAHDMMQKEQDPIRTLFEQFTAITVAFSDTENAPHLETIRQHNLDLLVVATDEQLTYYTAETDNDRVAILRQMVDTIERSRKNGMGELLAQSMEADQERPLIHFHPSAHSRDYFTVPRLVSILVCFLPFLLASVTIIIERDEHTLESLLVSLNANWHRLILGKALLPLLLGLFHFLLLALMSQSLFGLHLKSGFWSILTIQTAAATASLILGLAISCIVTSQLYALIASAIYLLCLILFTGFIFPIETASPLVRVLSSFFPLTFTLEPMAIWSFRGTGLQYHTRELAYLALQIVLYLFLAVQMVKKLRKGM